MSKKKLLFIYPSSYDDQNRLIKSKKSFVPSRALPYIAALTPKRYEIYFVDELIDDIPFKADVDLVVMSGMLRHMPRAVDIAKEFQLRKIPSIIGGIGAFSVQDYIKKSGAFESLVIGEVDEKWTEILDDFEEGRLKRRYECAPPAELKGFPPPRFDLLNNKKYMKSFFNSKELIIPVETSRGCPHNCNFCLVTCYFGKKMRYRPIGEVVEEIKYHGVRYIIFTDDNIAINPARARELFLAIKPLKMRWLAQFESRAIEDPELLRLAAESGCQSAFVGVESILPDNLRSANKHQAANLKFKDIVEGFHKAGINTLVSMIFGMENDTPEIIDRTIEEAIRSNVDGLIPWMLTPIPMTPCHVDHKNEKRLIHENYSLYDCWHPVTRPGQMTPAELEKSFWQGLRRFYSMRSILSRAWRGRHWSMSWLLCSLYFHRQVRKGLHPFSGNS